MFTKDFNSFSTFINCNDLFENYKINEFLEPDVFVMVRLARETLPYIALLDAKDVF